MNYLMMLCIDKFHLRDITAGQRPTNGSAGLEMYNKHFTNLTNHEYNIKMKQQNKK